MYKTIKKFQNYIKKFTRQISFGKNTKSGGVDKKKDVVYGGDLTVSTPTQSFGSILFNRMMRLDRREDIFQVDSLTKISMTTKQCLENSVALAEKLREQGVKTGDFIILLGSNGLNMNVALIGAFFLGAIPLPLNYKMNLDEFVTIVKSVKPKYFGCDQEYLYPFKKALAENSAFDVSKIFLLNQENNSEEKDIQGFSDFLKGRGRDFESFKPAAVTDPNNELALLMKAMSDGKAGRVVGITHHNLNSVIARFDSEDDGVKLKHKVLLMVQKVMWMSGIYALLLACCYGSKLVVTTEFDEEHFMKTVHDFKVTTTYIYSSKCWQLFKHVPIGEYDLSSCKDFFAVDGTLPKFLMDGLKEKTGIDPKSCYGTTEFTGLILVPSDTPREGSTGKLVAQAYGKVISDKTNKNGKPNERGELCFKGSTLSKGYINDPTSTKLLFDKEGYFLSGHYGYYDEDGYFYIIDKIIHQIKYKNFKISPRELEGLIKSLDSVKDVCVVGISHPIDGEHPIAFVSLIKGRKKISEKDIATYVNDKVPDSKKLRGGVIFITKVPRYRDNGAIKRFIFKKAVSKYRLKVKNENNDDDKEELKIKSSDV